MTVNPETGSKWSRQELLDAFARVEPPNWKDPINKVVNVNDWTVEDYAKVREAVVFFTGSVPSFSPAGYDVNNQPLSRVKAAGYYATVGA